MKKVFLMMNTRLFSFKNSAVLIGLLIFFIGIGGIIGGITSDSPSTWYQELNRSALTPPGFVFGIAWTILYALIAVSVWLIWLKRDQIALTPIFILFGIHMIFNWAWSFIFFEFHLIALSFFWILAVLALAVACATLFYKISKPAAALLVPYLGWLCFASYLSFYIWQNN